MLRTAMAYAYSSEPWHDLFVGVSGAAAVLTGLLFVSLSINVRQILGRAWLPRRAGLTLVLLFEALVIAILGLVPGQSPTVLAGVDPAPERRGHLRVGPAHRDPAVARSV